MIDLNNPFEPTLAEFVFTELPDYLDTAIYSENKISIDLFCCFDIIFEYDSSDEIPDWLTIHVFDLDGRETDIFKLTRKENAKLFNTFWEAYKQNYSR